MEAVRGLKNVAPKFLGAAGGLVAIFLTCTFFFFIKGIVVIFTERHNPPTTITFANAANRDVDWGPMPWIAFKLESFGEDFGPQFSKSKTTFATEDYKSKFTCSPPSELACPRPDVSVVTTKLAHKASQNNLAILDMTQIQPQWNHNTPRVNIILHGNTTRPTFTFYIGDAKQLADARDTHNVSKLLGAFKGHAVGKLSTKKAGCIRMYIELEKGIVPKDGTCWGFPWQDKCTENQFTMILSSFSDEEPVSDDCESGQIKIQIIVRSFMVRSVVPKSICTQLRTKFKSLGASLALMTTVFLFLFVRQYPSTHQEMMNTRLTLRGHEDKERPTFEEYEKMESAEYEETESAMESEAEAEK